MKNNQEKSFFITIAAVSLLLTVLVLRLFYIQIIKQRDYQTLSESIRARVITHIASRGCIYDRYGNVLAESRIIYDLYLVPYQMKEPEKVFAVLQQIGLKTDNLREKINKKNYLPYEPLLLKSNLDIRAISYLEELGKNLPGVVLSSRIVRNYPNRRIAAHLLGYVGEISKKELSYLKKYGYKLGDIVGMAGVEKYYDHYLKGINGGQPLEVDPLGNPIKELMAFEPIPGANLYLTIDLALQSKVEEIFANNKGGVVVLAVDSGEVLAMVSKPDYDPNYFTDILTEKEWQEILKSDHPLHNRVLTGYPPGSTFKIVTLMTALQDKLFNRKQRYYCPGAFYLGKRKFDCWLGHGHGNLDLWQGFINSCNVVFYNLGLMLGPQKIAETAVGFGFGLPTNIDLPYEEKGLIPTERWKKRKYDLPWYPGDSLNMAIGQGYILVSPLQMALAASALANENGYIFKPYLARKIIAPSGKVLLENGRELTGELPFQAENRLKLKSLMQDVVANGTGKRALVQGFNVCGKTGTAEHGAQKKAHAWFVSFAPYEEPEIAMAVFVEEGGAGGEKAAEISGQIYAWWYKHRSNHVGKI